MAIANFSTKSREWHVTKFDGNNAENLAWSLIKSMPDWDCINFGVENHIQDLRKAVKEHINPITKKIKSMPDFVAFNSKTGETHFVEVKFRSKFIYHKTGKSEHHINFLEEYRDYWPGTKLIMFQDYEPYIFVVDLDKIEDNMSRKEIGEGSYWNFEGIRQGIKELFPELEDKVLEDAKKVMALKEDK